MSRLTWGEPDARTYETGVDRGVLYVGSNPGVAWNGLVAVTENPTGGTSQPAYVDGYKFRNRLSPEDLELTIDAFASPPEFGPCDGSAQWSTGLLIPQQPRQSFGFSYRTMIANALAGDTVGYKIHLIYNAKATPSSRANNTMTREGEAQSKSWNVTMRAPRVAAFRPTPHFIIDSQRTDPTLLLDFENILYGTVAYAPRLPSVTELIEFFEV